MNPKTTVWLTAIALALFAYIFLIDLRTGSSPAEVAAQTRLLPDFEPTQVTALDVTRSNLTVRVQLINGRWQLLNPSYPAQATAIESFLHTLSTLQRQKEIPAEEIIGQAGGLSPFGLDPPAAMVKLQSGTNLLQVRVGGRTVLGDRVYVQPVGASGVYVTDAALLQHLPASATQWRDPHLIHPGPLQFDRIALTAGSRPLKIERDRTNQLWRLVEPLATRADFGRVEYLLQQLRSARVAQFISDNPREDLEPYGLMNPEAELTLAQGSNVVFQVQFGISPSHEPALVYARPLQHTNIVLISRELAELAQKPYTEFRDRMLITFRPGMVDRIEGQADESFALERQASGDWEIVEPFRAPADRQLMQLFLEDLGGLEIIRIEKEVVTDFAPYGLAKPARQYVLRNSLTNAVGPTNQLLAQVDFGAFPPDEPDKVYCRRSDESSVYVVSFAGMFRLERAAYALRDRRIWNFASSNVTQVTVLQRGQKREFNRDLVHRKWDRDNQVLHAALEEILHRLGSLRADAWAAVGAAAAEKFGTTEGRFDLELELKGGGQARELRLAFGKLAAGGQPYAAVTLEQKQPVVFKFPTQLFALIAEYLSVPSVNAEL